LWINRFIAGIFSAVKGKKEVKMVDRNPFLRTWKYNRIGYRQGLNFNPISCNGKQIFVL
jgi:hypothetical protein